MLIAERFEHEKIVSIIGLAKNTGKTVALNSLLRELRGQEKVVGITSIGRDGERYDALNDAIEKPSIVVPEGNLVATTDELVDGAAAQVEILRRTRCRTALGTVVIGRVMRRGRIEVAGASTVSGTREICRRMLALGAEVVLVDGAINRKASASSLVADGVIVATGAVLSASRDRVVHETKHQIDLLNLPAVSDPSLRELALTARGVAVVDREPGGETYRLRPLDLETVVANGEALARELTECSRYVIFRRSLMESMVEAIARRRRGRPLTFLVDHASRVFLTPQRWQKWQAQGLAIQALHPIRLISVTVNPTSPASHRFESDELVAEVRQVLGDAVPVYDVMSPAYQAQLGPVEAFHPARA